MSSGIPYDSEAGRAICGALSAIMTGVSYATSAEMAAELGPFPRYEENRDAMLRVMRNHRRAAYGDRTGYEQVDDAAGAARPQGQSGSARWRSMPKLAWDRALALGEEHGYRNAQATVVAPTGTIGLVMDCDTTGIEPDFALVKFKKLAGGGYFKIINRAVPEALRVLGYGESDIAEIVAYAVGHGSLGQAPAINHTTLKAKGFTAGSDREAWKRRCRPPSTSNSPSTSGRWAQTSARCARRRRRGAGGAELRPALASRLHQARDRRGQHPCLRRHDGRRRAAFEARALRGVRLRQSVRPHRQALPLGAKATSA